MLSAVDVGGFGQHLKFQKVEAFLKCVYAVTFLYIVALGLTKYSIIFFYRRIFRISAVKVPLYILGGFLTAFLLSAVCSRISLTCRSLHFRIGYCLHCALRSGARVLGQEYLLEVLRRAEILLGCVYSKHYLGLLDICFPSATGLEPPAARVTEDCCDVHPCDWWLVSNLRPGKQIRC